MLVYSRGLELETAVMRVISRSDTEVCIRLAGRELTAVGNRCNPSTASDFVQLWDKVSSDAICLHVTTYLTHTAGQALSGTADGSGH